MTSTSVTKALALLRAVQEHGHEAPGVSALARYTGLTKSTAFRLLTTLEEDGAVVRAGEGYRLGDFLGSVLTLPTDEVTERVQVTVTPFLSALYERSRLTVQLAVLDDGSVLVLNKLHGLHRVPSPSRIGGHVPAHATSLGKVLLAFDPEARDLVLSRPLEAWTSRTITDPERLLQEIARAERTRIGRDDGGTVPGVASIASVVLDRHSRAVAALCVTGPRADVVGAGYEQHVLEVCAMASRAYVAAEADDDRRSRPAAGA